jgi:hypothetical protein
MNVYMLQQGLHTWQPQLHTSVHRGRWAARVVTAHGARSKAVAVPARDTVPHQMHHVRARAEGWTLEQRNNACIIANS